MPGNVVGPPGSSMRAHVNRVTVGRRAQIGRVWRRDGVGKCTFKCDDDNGQKRERECECEYEQQQFFGGTFSRSDERRARVRREVWDVAKIAPERGSSESESRARVRQRRGYVGRPRRHRSERLSGPDLHVLDLANYHAANNNNKNENENATNSSSSKPAKELKWQRVVVSGKDRCRGHATRWLYRRTIFGVLLRQRRVEVFGRWVGFGYRGETVRVETFRGDW